ncbi:MAG TPA: penicillin-binding protein activator [Longimicrobiales bacterium]|nr:penicillin-binding protein activator [Longimicrobiales bacterium]
MNRVSAPDKIRRALGRAAVLLAALALAACASAPPAPERAAPPTLLDMPASPEEERRAAALLEEARIALEAGDAAEARTRAETVVERHPGTQASVPALLIASRAAALMGDDADARAGVERYLALFPADAPEAETARALLGELEERARARAERARTTVVLGALLPRTGELGRYAEWVLEGARLAASAFEERTGRPTRLVILDHGDDMARLPALVAELEAEGASGILGPLLSEAVAAAAAARERADLPVVSPTASTAPGAPQAYTLNAPGVRAAARLAEYAAAAELRTVGVLHPATAEGWRQAGAFLERARALGLEVVAEVPYDSGATSFARPIERLRSAAPQALYLPVPERDVPQLAPQLAVYWLKAALLAVADSGAAVPPPPAPELPRVMILGGEAWATPAVRRAWDPSLLDSVVVALPVVTSSAGAANDDFAARYAAAYRRTLDNPYPALGHDAMVLLLAAAEGDTPFAELRDVEGATGTLRAGAGIIEREPVLARIVGGALVPLEPTDGEGGERR